MTTRIKASSIRRKRVYEPPSRADGMRVLVDRLWPRGVSRDDAAIDLWPRDIAPSEALRGWFAHDPQRWDEFRRRYANELREQAALLAPLRKLAREAGITLVYAARDEARNNAVVVREVLLGRRVR
jgi:uncharacterized protein YeaO (DUF488 family)